jgi:hypothetical protein
MCTTGVNIVFSQEHIRFANRYFNLSDSSLWDLLNLSASFTGDETIQKLALEFHGVFFHSDTETFQAARDLKDATAHIGDRQAGFSALVIISGIEHMIAFYRKREIPESILRDSLQDMRIWMNHYRQSTGITGVVDVAWLLLSLRGSLFRLGRLEFMRQGFGGKIGVAARRTDGVKVALFMQPERLRGDGLIDGTNGIFDTGNGWESSFEMTDDTIAGYPIHPGGYAVHETLKLPRSQWELCLQPSDCILDMHVPKDGRLDFGQCRDSILSANEFYGRYFPEKPFRAFNISSWLMDAQLQKLLPEDSNIVRFQREFYLYPVLAAHNDAYARIFGDPDIDITKAPETTALQRAVKSYVLAGNSMRECAGLILPEDLARFGQAQYQTGAAAMLAGVLEHAGSGS